VLLEPLYPRRSEEVSFAEVPEVDKARTSMWSQKLMAKKTKLGAGSYGTVFLVRPNCDQAKSYALKVQRPRSAGDRHWEPEMNSEVQLMLKFNSPRFVQLLDYGYGKKGGSKQHSILMEAADSDLGKYTDTGPPENSWERVVVFMADLLEGIEEMHAANVVHRDLKPGNVLVKCESGQCHAKIADLGMSCKIGTPDCSGIGGTPLYFAPELLKTKSPALSNDMWGMGVMMYELLFKSLPKGIGASRSLEELYANIKKMKDTSYITQQNVGARMRGASSTTVAQTFELLGGLLEPTSARRLSADAAASKARELARGVKVSPLKGAALPPCWFGKGAEVAPAPKTRPEPEPEPPVKGKAEAFAADDGSAVGEEDFVSIAKPGQNMAAALVLRWATGVKSLAEIQKTAQKYLPKALREGDFELLDINKYTPEQIKGSRDLAEGLKDGVHGDLVVHVKVLRK